MESYRVFTISLEGVKPFARTWKKNVTDDIVIDVVSVGESGRGRKLSYIPVHTLVRSDEPAEIRFVEIGETKRGAIKFFEVDHATSDDYCIAVLKSSIGFRGGNRHTGDYYYEEGVKEVQFYPFPGELLAEGTIAQGAAGAMGSGQQFIVKMPRDVVFRIARSGRLYGALSSFYHLFNGETIYRLTKDERDAADLF